MIKTSGGFRETVPSMTTTEIRNHVSIRIDFARIAAITAKCWAPSTIGSSWGTMKSVTHIFDCLWVFWLGIGSSSGHEQHRRMDNGVQIAQIRGCCSMVKAFCKVSKRLHRPNVVHFTHCCGCSVLPSQRQPGADIQQFIAFSFSDCFNRNMPFYRRRYLTPRHLNRLTILYQFQLSEDNTMWLRQSGLKIRQCCNIFYCCGET